MSREFLKAKAHAEIDRIFATGGVTEITITPEIEDNDGTTVLHEMSGSKAISTRSGVREELTIRISAVYPTPEAPDA